MTLLYRPKDAFSLDFRISGDRDEESQESDSALGFLGFGS
jgi:hypothetical protein